ncbi:MAG: hypothetical protein ACYS1A_07665 [Planctomycetota bacterium]
MKSLTYKHSISKPFIYLGLVALMMVVSLSDYCYASPDMDPGSIDWDSVTLYAYFPKKAGPHLYWIETKRYEATSSLESSHCKTDYGTEIEHVHFQNVFSEEDITYANIFWDFFFYTSTRISNATNQRNCLSYAMDGYAGSANYDYWINPGNNGQQGNTMFTDDCMNRYPVHEVEIYDRLAYLLGTYIMHATIVQDEYDNEPTCLQWKNGASGVYQFDTSIAADPFDTPGCDIPDPPPEPPEPLTGTYDPDWCPGDYAIGFYE